MDNSIELKAEEEEVVEEEDVGMVSGRRLTNSTSSSRAFATSARASSTSLDVEVVLEVASFVDLKKDRIIMAIKIIAMIVMGKVYCVSIVSIVYCLTLML